MRGLKIIALVVLGLGTGVVLPWQAAAQSTCDPDFMTVMGARAWMSANRDMEAAQKLILKPDSVLEYSCFNTRLTEVANNTTFVNAGGGINDVVRTPQVGFLQSFSHTLGGGTAPGSPIGSTCNAMYAIWDLLKCDNFNKADFQEFRLVMPSDGRFSSLDRRTLPAACSDAAGRKALWDAAIAAAFPAPATPAASGGMDVEATYLTFLDPTKCSTLKPITTGVTFQDWNYSATPATYTLKPEKVCPAPSCFYDYGSNKCK